MPELITAILIGAGSRGLEAYGKYALRNPERLKFIAVAEPREAWRKNFAKIHEIPPENCFESWEPLLKKEQFARAAVICTPDHLHVEPTLQALEQGYDVLLEKPMANRLEGCVKLVEKAKEVNRSLQICHVLRYTNFWSTVKSFVDSGQIGEMTSISLGENVAYWHYVHSWVRGNWRNSNTSSPMILAKCCHDMDLLYWIVGVKPKWIASFGSLSHFRPEKAPPGVPNRCTDGCPVFNTCKYNAVKIYIDLDGFFSTGKNCPSRFLRFFSRHRNFVRHLSRFSGSARRIVEFKEWPVSMITSDYTLEGKMKALREGPYGRCVYHCDNNVVDHQQTTIEFENGVTAELTMHGHSALEKRTLRIDGTKGTLMGDFWAWDDLFFWDSATGEKKQLIKPKLMLEAHGGGDLLLTEGFVDSLQPEFKSVPLTDAQASLESHLMAFAAEKARVEKKLINMDEYCSNII